MASASCVFVCFCIIISMLPVVETVATQEVQVYYPKERDALILLRESVTSSAIDLHSNWTGPPCTGNRTRWAGIACLNSHVVHLVLDGIQLTGSLPPTKFLQDVTYLSKISFRNNSLTGRLPAGLRNLTHLQFVFLSHNQFSGAIPLEYTYISSLTWLELQENQLNGRIPPFDQPSLTTFNVSDNNLQGQIPDTPVLVRFPTSSYQHNPSLCGKPLPKQCPAAAPPNVAPPSPSPIPSTNAQKKILLKIWSIVLIAVGAVLVPSTMMLLVFLCYNKRRKRGKRTRGEDSSGEASVDWAADQSRRPVQLEFFDKSRSVIFDLDDLLRASAELMGKGQLGSTYKAMLESGLIVAVKKLKDMNGLSKEKFARQMLLLGNMKHENLVKVISFYYSKEDKLVVYEYVPRSLFELLHGRRGAGRAPLDCSTRLSIVKGIAKGVEYLHQASPNSYKIPHANLKSSNVLISYDDDDDGQRVLQPKLTDFGFQSLLPSRISLQRLAAARAPEVSRAKKATPMADVYCLGILLLEIVTGRIPEEFYQGNGDKVTHDLSEWVRSVVDRDWSTDILDLEIARETAWQGEMLRLTEIALECTNSVPEQRPSMKDVLRRIEEIKHESNNAAQS